MTFCILDMVVIHLILKQFKLFIAQTCNASTNFLLKVFSLYFSVTILRIFLVDVKGNMWDLFEFCIWETGLGNSNNTHLKSMVSSYLWNYKDAHVLTFCTSVHPSQNNVFMRNKCKSYFFNIIPFSNYIWGLQTSINVCNDSFQGVERNNNVL